MKERITRIGFKELKVKSFITSLKKNKTKTIIGGAPPTEANAGDHCDTFVPPTNPGDNNC